MGPWIGSQRKGRKHSQQHLQLQVQVFLVFSSSQQTAPCPNHRVCLPSCRVSCRVQKLKKKKRQYKVTSLRYRHIPIEVGKILKNLNGAAIGKRWWRYRAERRIQLSELQSLIQFHLHILQAGKLHRKMKQVVQEQTVVSAEPGQEARYFFNLYIAAAKKKTNGQGVLKSYHVEWAAHVFENSSAGQGKGFLPALPSPSAISSPGCKNCKVLRKPTSVEERNQR